MVFTLKSLEFMNGVENFKIEENEVKENEWTTMIAAETDAGISLMLEWKMRLSEDSDMCTTCNCPVDFGDRAVILEHYQSHFHRTNTLRKARNLPVLSEEDFEGTEGDQDHDLSQSTTTSTTIGLESDDEEFDALLLPANRSFFVKEGHVFSIPRNILHVDETDVTSSIFLRPFNCAIILWNGGHFAAAVFENDKIVVQKSFHRYVARAKQGGVQSQHDSGGKGAAKSAGAQLRRYNEQKMKEEIQQMMSSWKSQIQRTPLLFIRCAAYHRNVFFEAGDGFLDSKDARIRTIPFETKRPNSEEIQETWRRLQIVQEHGRDSEFRSEMEEVREKRKKLARKVAGKRKRKDGGMICEWSDDDEEDKNPEDVRKERRIRIRTIRKSEDVVVQWPELTDEWRQKTYNLVRQDDVDALRMHIESVNEDVRADAIDYLKNAKIPPNRSTFLHVSAANSAKKCLKYFLTTVHCDSGAKDGAGLPPYSSAANSEIKAIFIDFRVENEQKLGGNWGRTHIPEPKKKIELTEEQEREKQEKQREKKQRQKEKEKQRKEEAKRDAEEAKERETYVKMSEREKRAMAVERRLAGQPPVMRCHQCGTLLPPTPFQYSHFNFCTTSCVAEHRKANPS